MPAGSLHPVSRSVTFAPGLVAAAGGWAYLGQPAHLAGLGVMAAAGLVTWPCLVMMMLFAPAVMLGACVPRRWRIGHRQRHGREHCRSAYISDRLRRVTFAADRYRCMSCRAAGRGRDAVVLHADHIRPWAGGYLTLLANMGTLCSTCNLLKSNYSRDRDGYEHYAGNRANIQAAREILRRERIRRLSPLRWVRAAWALAS
jgi:hypothetical protein